jgi:cell wall-associated NlpC family hydrolase
MSRVGELSAAYYKSGQGAKFEALLSSKSPTDFADKLMTVNDMAKVQSGHPYSWGAAGPKYYDCSGLTLTAWAAAGVTLGHYTEWQWNETKAVSADALQPGDLIFFYSDRHHVGIYVGNGWMVHAPTTGDFVRMAQIAGRPIAGYRRPG